MAISESLKKKYAEIRAAQEESWLSKTDFANKTLWKMWSSKRYTAPEPTPTTTASRNAQARASFQSSRWLTPTKATNVTTPNYSRTTKTTPYSSTSTTTTPSWLTSQRKTSNVFGDVWINANRDIYKGEWVKTSWWDVITKFSKPLDVAKELDVYGEAARQREKTAPWSLSARNDALAYNLKAGWVDTKEGIADYLATREWFWLATPEEQQNTINALAARIWVDKVKEEEPSLLEQQQWQLFSDYQEEQDKLIAEWHNQDVVKRMDHILGEEIRGLNDDEVNQIAQEIGMSPEDVRATADERAKARQRMADPYQQREEDLETTKQRNIEDANIKLDRTTQQINDNISDITTQMERNVAWSEKVWALKGFVQSSGYMNGIQNVKDDANKLITRQRRLLDDATTDTAKYVNRTNTDFTKNMDRLQKDFTDWLLNLRLAGTNEVNTLLTKYSPSDKLMKTELDRLNEEYWLKSMDLYSKFLTNFKWITEAAFSEVDKIQEYQTKQRELENLTLSQLYANNWVALMNMSDADIQNLADQWYIRQDQVSQLKGAREWFKQQATASDTTLQWKTTSTWEDAIFNPNTWQYTIIWDTTWMKNMWSNPKTTNAWEYDWDIDVEMWDQVTSPISWRVHFETHEDTGNIAVEITWKDWYMIEINHLDPMTLEALQYLEWQEITVGDVIWIGWNTWNVKDIEGNWLRKDGQVINQSALDQWLWSHLDIRVVDPNGRDLSGEEVKNYISGKGAGTYGSLSPTDKQFVNTLVNYQTNLPSRASKNYKQIMAAAAELDPTFNASKYDERKNFQKQWNTTTIKGGSLSKAATTLQLAAQLENIYKGLKWQTRVQALNSFVNEVNRQIGNPAITNFDVARDLVVKEMAGAFKGTASPTDNDIKDMNRLLSGKLTPEQTQQAIEVAAWSMFKRINSEALSYNNIMGKLPDSIFDKATEQWMLSKNLPVNDYFKPSTLWSVQETEASWDRWDFDFTL